MAKKVRLIFISFVGIILVAVASLIVVNILNDENKLTVEENKWLNNNLSTVLNVNVINDLDIFGKSGAGVFYDFLNDLGKEYNLKIKKFPAGIIANMFGFEQKEYFQATQESKEVPNVQF